MFYSNPSPHSLKKQGNLDIENLARVPINGGVKRHCSPSAGIPPNPKRKTLTDLTNVSESLVRVLTQINSVHPFAFTFAFDLLFCFSASHCSVVNCYKAKEARESTACD